MKFTMTESDEEMLMILMIVITTTIRKNQILCAETHTLSHQPGPLDPCIYSSQAVDEDNDINNDINDDDNDNEDCSKGPDFANNVVE